MSTQEATLYIDRSSSSCGNCNAPVDPYSRGCYTQVGWDATRGKPGCGAVFTSLSSNYAMLEPSATNMRPDLEWIGTVD